MIDYKLILQNLKKDPTKTITTKKLKELGLNDYYIKKAVTEKKLKKIARGKYIVISNEIIYNNLKTHIYNKQFEEAYNDLQLILKENNQIQYKYYLILLNNILNKPNDPEDINLLNNHLITEKQKTLDKKLYFELAEAILTSNFNKALEIIITIGNIEKEKNNFYDYKTTLFYQLIKSVVTKKKEEEKIINKKKASKYYNDFKKNIENNDYESALINLQEAKKYSSPKTINKISSLINLITTYLEINETKEPLPEKNINYDFLDDKKILIKAIHLKDYQTAQKVIEKFNDETISKTLSIYRIILNKIITKNNKNILSTQTININELYYLISNKEYENAKELLEKSLKKMNNNTYSQIYNMLTIIQKIKPKNTEETKKNTEDNIIIKSAIYKLLIKEILNNIDPNKTNEEIYDLISNIINNETLPVLESIIEENIETCEKETIYNEYLLELIDIIKTTKKYKLTKDYFNTDDNNNDFFTVLNNGDYPQALNIISQENVIDKNINWYLSLYKILLLKLSKELKNNEKTIYNGRIKLQVDTESKLSNLKKLIEHNKYQQAYDLYKNEDFSDISNDLNQELQRLLPLLVQTNSNYLGFEYQLKYLKKNNN